METKCVFVVFNSRLHLEVSLVTNNMIDFQELDIRHVLVEGLFVVVSLVAWEENSLVVDVLNESVSGVSIGPDGSNDNGSVFV